MVRFREIVWIASIVVIASSKWISSVESTHSFINRSPFIYTRTTSGRHRTSSDSKDIPFKPIRAMDTQPAALQSTLEGSTNVPASSYADSKDDLTAQQTIWRPYLMLPRLMPSPPSAALLHASNHQSLFTNDFTNSLMAGRASAGVPVSRFPPSFYSTSGLFDDLPFAAYTGGQMGPPMLLQSYDFDNERNQGNVAGDTLDTSGLRPPTVSPGASIASQSTAPSTASESPPMPSLTTNQPSSTESESDAIGVNVGSIGQITSKSTSPASSADTSDKAVGPVPIATTAAIDSTGKNAASIGEVELLNPVNMKNLVSSPNHRLLIPPTSATESNTNNGTSGQSHVRPMPVIVRNHSIGREGSGNIQMYGPAQHVQPNNFRLNYSQIRKQNVPSTYWPHNRTPSTPLSSITSSTSSSPTPNMPSSTVGSLNVKHIHTEWPTSINSGNHRSPSSTPATGHRIDAQQLALLKKLQSDHHTQLLKDSLRSTSSTSPSAPLITSSLTSTPASSTSDSLFTSSPSSTRPGTVPSTFTSSSSRPHSAANQSTEAPIDSEQTSRKLSKSARPSTIQKYTVLVIALFVLLLLCGALTWAFWKEQLTTLWHRLNRSVKSSAINSHHHHHHHPQHHSSSSGSYQISGPQDQPPPLDTSESIYGIRRFSSNRGNLNFSPSFFPSSAAAAAAASVVSGSKSNGRRAANQSNRANTSARSNRSIANQMS